MLSYKEKENIVSAARGFRERLHDPNDDLEEQVIERWVERVGDGEIDSFHRRLNVDDEEVVGTAFQENSQPDGKLPLWIDELDDLLEHVLSTTENNDEYVIGENDIAFAHILTPIVSYASEKIGVLENEEMLSQQAKEDFKRYLAERLLYYCHHPLFIEFKIFVEENKKTNSGEGKNSKSAELYDRFVEIMLDGQLKTLFIEYPVLGKLVIKIVNNWIEHIEEFLQRLEKDYSKISHEFASGENIGSVSQAEFLGDSHNSGRRVISLVFSSGVKVAYKPRCVRVDKAFYDFISYINDSYEGPDLRRVKCIPRDGYGWIEWVESKQCNTIEEVSKYYQRAGQLLCLLYVLEFSDGHVENIIASGSQPVVVDLETIGTPRPDTGGDISPEHRRLLDSVVRTGLLPTERPHSDYDNIGGFGKEDGRQVNAAVHQFTDVNTDQMDLIYSGSRSISGNNVPIKDGTAHDPSDYVDEILKGFSDIYKLMLKNKRKLLDDQVLLRKFSEAECRYIHRPSHMYAQVLNTGITTKFLRKGSMFGCKIEELAKNIDTEEGKGWMWDVYKVERNALWSLDFPRFTVDFDSNDIESRGFVAKNALMISPIEQVRRNIDSMSICDLQEQRNYIKGAFHPHELDNATIDEVHKCSKCTIAHGSSTDFEQIIDHIFERIDNSKVQTNQGHEKWVIRRNYNKGIYLGTTDGSLYDGNIGIGVFCAALWNTYRSPKFNRLASDSVSFLDEETFDPQEQGVGGGVGLGSHIYGLTKMGEFLEEPKYIDKSESMVSMIDDSVIDQITDFDVLRGGAGLILSLLSYYETTEDHGAVNKAISIGEHLLSSRVKINGHRVWNGNSSNQPATGFMHGIAGIAYSLTRLSDAANMPKFERAAMEAIEYENGSYSEGENSSSDFRERPNASHDSGWCNGWSGIGLARLEMYGIKPRDCYRTGVERAIRETERHHISHLDNLCCGNFGEVEFLLRLGEVFEHDKYTDQAKHLATLSARRAKETDGFNLPWSVNSWYNPTLFLGEAGVGYTLLRLVNPDLPSLLSWR